MYALYKSAVELVWTIVSQCSEVSLDAVTDRPALCIELLSRHLDHRAVDGTLCILWHTRTISIESK